MAGTNFTLRGLLDDDTASVSVSGSGTGTVLGVVERGGAFRVAGLLLAGPTNFFTVTASNVWGQTASLPLTVLRSGINTTMDPLSTDQLSQEYITVTGTVSDLTQDVWINGVQAVNRGNSWIANNVPVPDTAGTTEFDINVYPGGSDPSLTTPTGS